MSTDKTRLLLSEYGRNVQKMVNYLKTIEDRDERNRQAEVVVAVMGNVNPAQKDSEKFQHMLWDHLFMIADFDLDVDAPFEKPTPDMFAPNPQRVSYSQHYIAQKQYGSNVYRMLKKLSLVTDEDPNEPGTVEERNAAAANVAKYMRQKSYEYNKEYPSNEVVIADIRNMSDGVIELEADTLDGSKVDTSSAGGKKTSSRNGSNSAGGKNNSGNNGRQQKKQHTKARK